VCCCVRGCAQELGNLKSKMPVNILERRQTPEGVRAYISTIPSESHIQVTVALNEFNHSVQRFPSVSAYEAARANYLEDIVVREASVEDAITGNNLRIKDQTLHISTATEEQENARAIPSGWNVTSVLDLVTLFLVASPGRIFGSHSTQPVLVRAGPGTGKTWMAKQAVFTLADRLLHCQGGATNDGIRLVPIVVFVQRIIYLLRESNDSKNADKKDQTLLERYIQSVYAGKKFESWCTMLMQAYEMRALVVLLDGVDEAAGLRDQIEVRHVDRTPHHRWSFCAGAPSLIALLSLAHHPWSPICGVCQGFVHRELVPSGNRVLVTSRPEGVQLSTYSKTFIVMNLCALTNDQQRRVINIQMHGNIFFDHLLSLGEVPSRPSRPPPASAARLARCTALPSRRRTILPRTATPPFLPPSPARSSLKMARPVTPPPPTVLASFGRYARSSTSRTERCLPTHATTSRRSTCQTCGR
jgi:hypothetical protein